MLEVISSNVTVEVTTLDEAMKVAKILNEFVTIKGAGFEIVGRFGVDTIKDGVCPDGVKYDWIKRRKVYETHN